MTMKDLDGFREICFDLNQRKNNTPKCTTCPPGMCPSEIGLRKAYNIAQKKAEDAVLEWISQECKEL
jgi:hypothetical protein